MGLSSSDLAIHGSWGLLGCGGLGCRVTLDPEPELHAVSRVCGWFSGTSQDT